MVMAKGRGRQDVIGRSLLKKIENRLDRSLLQDDKSLGECFVLVMVSSYLLLSFKVLQLMSSMYTIIRGTVCGQQGSGSNWAEYLRRITR